jgi:hypothetical protein
LLLLLLLPLLLLLLLLQLLFMGTHCDLAAAIFAAVH